MEVPPPFVLPAIDPVAPIERAPVSASEQSRSAVWPLVMAVGVGVALGFAAGYGVGFQERAVLAPAAQAVVLPAGQDFTEREVTDPGRAVGTNADRPTPANGAPGESGAAPSVGSGLNATPPTVVERGTPQRAPAAARAARAAPSPARNRPLPPPRPIETGRASAAALTVESKPSGAHVFVNNRLIGTTPVSVSTIAAGDHTIRLELNGYRLWSSPVHIMSSGRNRVTASLER